MCVLIVMTVVVGPVEGVQEKVRKLRVEHLLRPDSIQLAELHTVQSNLEKEGLIKLQIKGAAPSVNAGRTIIDRVRSGKLDLAVVPLTAMADVVPLFRMFEIPFLFRDAKHMSKTLFAFENYDKLHARDSLHAAGLESVGWLSGEPLVIASRWPLLEPDDLRGLKVARTSSIEFGEPSATELFGRKLDAVPVRLTPSTSVKELLDGRVDVIEIELSELSKFKAEQIFVSETDHLHGGYIIIVNPARWKALPEALRAQISREFADANGRTFRMTRKATQRASQTLEKQTGIILIPVVSAVRKEWRDATSSESLAIQAGESNVELVEHLMVTAMAEAPYGEDGGGWSVAMSWNAWFERGLETSAQDAPVLEVNDVYRFYLDLARYAYSRSLSAGLSTSLAELLGGKGERILLLHPVLLGDELTVAPGKSLQPREITVKLERGRADPHDKEVVDRFQKKQISTRGLSQAVNLGGFASWDIKAAKPGCARIAITVWDQAHSMPLDHIVLTVPVHREGKGPESCGWNNTSKAMTAGLRSMLEGPLPAEDMRIPDAALHIFEVDEGGQSVSHAVLLHRHRLLAALGKTEVSDSGVYAWKLASVLSAYVSKPDQLPQLIQEAHQAIVSNANTKYPYEEVAREIALKLFSGQSEYDREQATKARAAFLDAVDNTSDPVVVVRFVSPSGTTEFIPFGLIAARGDTPVVSKRFTVIQPLPKARSTSTNCVDTWSLARPKILQGVGGEALKQLAATAATPAPKPFQVLPDHRSLVSYFKSSGASDLERGEGLILLAHHDKGYLRYNNTDRPPARIAKEYIDRRFRPGSVAVLAACTTVGNADETSGIVNRLVSQGVDSLIVSPFAVDAQFGTHFALEFEKQVVAERAKKSGASIRTLFEQATANVMATYEDQALRRDMALEFMLVGDADLRLCH